jgi:predicted RNA-binding Zn-ribbon protein involved in translation (DUF1610 family)
MPRLIDADALTEILEKMPAIGFKNIDNQTYTLVLLAQVFNIIEQQPTIEERKKGKWIKMSDADGVYWVCSECGEDIPRAPHYNPQFDLFPRLESIEKTNFCPNCGADMRGEGNV